MSHTKIQDTFKSMSATGEYERHASGFREHISVDHPVYQPASQRYHVYISRACPWANGVLAVLRLKGLQNCIGVTVTHPTWQRSNPDDPKDTHCGWAFAPEGTPLTPPSGVGSISVKGHSEDTINNCRTIRDLYQISERNAGKVGSVQHVPSVPVLWDTKTGTIVNNESIEICHMLNSQFNEYATGPYATHDLYPEALRAKIDAINEWVYKNINNGVYRCGFAKSQGAYEAAFHKLFGALDDVEDILSKNRYLCGDILTLVDIRLFMTLCRFDEVYVVYFKTNKKRMVDYPSIRNYMREVYQMPFMGPECVNMDHIKTHYFTSHPALNSYSIYPLGPDAVSDWNLPHDRATVIEGKK